MLTCFQPTLRARLLGGCEKKHTEIDVQNAVAYTHLGLRAVALEMVLDNIVVELLAPQKPRGGLYENVALRFRQLGRHLLCKELVVFLSAKI